MRILTIALLFLSFGSLKAFAPTKEVVSVRPSLSPRQKAVRDLSNNNNNNNSSSSSSSRSTLAAMEGTINGEVVPPRGIELSHSYIQSKTMNVLSSAMLLTMTHDSRYIPTSSGFIVAAGFAHILAGAAEHDRLSSDTYKRLNLGLLGFHFINLAMMPGTWIMLKTIPQSYFYLIAATFGQLFGSFICYKGWRMGFDTSINKEVSSGVMSTLRGLMKAKGRGILYYTTLLLFGGGVVRSLVKCVQSILSTTATFAESTVWIGGLARLGMLSNLLYCLKDAAERNRLTGTSFIHMHYIIGLWMFLNGLGQAARPDVAFLVPGAAFVAGGAIFFVLGYLTTQEKNGDLVYSSTKHRWVAPDFGIPKALEVISEEEET